MLMRARTKLKFKAFERRFQNTRLLRGQNQCEGQAVIKCKPGIEKPEGNIIIISLITHNWHQ